MKLIYADCETTGLDYRSNEMVQFAFIIEVNKIVVEEVNFKMRPAKPDTVSEEALKVTHRTLADLLAYPERRDQYARIVDVLGKHVKKYDRGDKLHWVGQNPSFDMPFVRSFFEEHGDKYFGSWFDNRPVDTIALAKAACLRGHFKTDTFKLGKLCELHGVALSADDAHDALSDVRATRELFHKMMDLYIVRPAAKVSA